MTQRRSAKEIFSAAAELPKEARNRYLDEACGNDHVLRQRVLGLLAADDNPDSLLNRPAAEVLLAETSQADAGVPAATGTLLGPYKLLQEIGQGGMALSRHKLFHVHCFRNSARISDLFFCMSG